MYTTLLAGVLTLLKYCKKAARRNKIGNVGVAGVHIYQDTWQAYQSRIVIILSRRRVACCKADDVSSEASTTSITLVLFSDWNASPRRRRLVVLSAELLLKYIYPAASRAFTPDDSLNWAVVEQTPFSLTRLFILLGEPLNVSPRQIELRMDEQNSRAAGRLVPHISLYFGTKGTPFLVKTRTVQ